MRLNAIAQVQNVLNINRKAVHILTVHQLARGMHNAEQTLQPLLRHTSY